MASKAQSRARSSSATTSRSAPTTSVALAASTATAKLNALRQHFTLREPDVVSAFLKSNPFLTPLALTAIPYIQEQFGKEARLTLKVRRDPEGDSLTLGLYILTDVPVEPALHKLDELDERW